MKVLLTTVLILFIAVAMIGLISSLKEIIEHIKNQ